ncbi:FMNH(2)-dependent dimethylsulfone monooxygenase [Fulvia fulva]|nr:FMNH(2)-dependent dimethylsulfone monooxygenase [Fulvia fulva]
MYHELGWLDRIIHWIRDPAPLALITTALVLFVGVHAVGYTADYLTMPSTYSNSPFVSLKADQNCGRANGSSTSKSFASLSGNATPAINGGLNGQVNGHTNGHSNGVKHAINGDDEFLRLDAPQQDLLLLHGPRQKYSLEKSRGIPELQGDREILVQVLAIGLNPVDWKGADYGFSQPSYPWVNGRDFAGIVVRAPRDSSRVKQGDVVFGPSTDYRDVRKAAYQEYVVTTDYNVTRVPAGVTVKEGAALGVAYVAAVTALGISFGVDFTSLQSVPAGPDLLRLTRTLERSKVPQDIHNEIFNGIPVSERPIPGEWLAIWGANSMTGQISLQLAKNAGLKVACIADIAKGGARLSELGADFLVDKYDNKRAVEILKAVTGGKLRFGIDCNGKDTATSLQDALSSSGPRGHLLGLAGLPKNIGPNVVHHQIPIKIFHEAPQVGEAISTWLEDLLIARSLKLPEVEIAEGGLAGINDALDRMRTGQIGGRRIVVPVGGEKSGAQSPAPAGVVPNGIGNAAVGSSSNDLSYADEMNSDPERVRFAYWVPNVSGGLVISKIKQNTRWDLKSNVTYARTAEKFGFEYALSQIRFMAGYGAENQHEPVSFSQALLMNTERLKVIAALLPGPWNPAVAAKQIASIDNYCDGRVCVNVVSGWFRAEFASIGQWWLDHAERYRRSKEFIACLKGIWTNEKFTYNSDFYQFHDYPLKPKPLNLPGRPYPEIFQGGNSDDAKENAGSVSDYYFMNGNTLEGFQTQIADVKERAKKNNREGQVGFALNAFVICRETEEEAIRVLQDIQGKADPEAVEGFRQQVQNAGSSTGNKSGMWANSKFEDLVQYNDGFKTKLIGTKEQIAERIVLLKSLGVNIILTAFLHYDEEIEAFGREVLPLVRELERQGRGRDEAHEISITGDVYKKK